MAKRVTFEVQVRPDEDRWPGQSSIEDVLNRSGLPCASQQKAYFDGLKQVGDLVLQWQVGPDDFVRLAEVLIGLANLGLRLYLLRREARPRAKSRPVATELDVGSRSAQDVADALHESVQEGDLAPPQKAGAGTLFPPIPVRPQAIPAERQALENARVTTFLELLEKAQLESRD